MTNKLHNRTLFVAALSVYFGLLIVGAPPQVLAQQSTQTITQKDQPTVILSENGNERSLTYLFRQLAEILNKTAANKSDAHFSFASDVINGKLINFQILANEGNSEIIKLLQEITDRFDLKQLASFEGILSVQRVSRDYKVDSTGFAATSSYSFESVSKAKEYAETLESVFAKLKETAKLSKQTSTGNDFSVQRTNNQIFIVTRLPRGSLDSLFKAGEKAN